MSGESGFSYPVGDSRPPPADIPLANLAFIRADHGPYNARLLSKGLTQVDIVHVVEAKPDPGLSEFKLLPLQVSSFRILIRDLARLTTEHPELECRIVDCSTPRHLDVIVNSSAGDGRAAIAFMQVVEPFLLLADVRYSVHHTTGVDDAARIGREISEREVEHGAQRTIAVLGGDGTTHELLNGLLLTAARDELVPSSGSTNLVILPFGTANAFYYHLFPPESPSTPVDSPLSAFYSLLSFLRAQPSHTLPINVALNDLPTSPTKVITSVVSSAALHASILFDAEELRASIPGVDRFKVAAQKNSTTWWHGRLLLLPEAGHGVRQYDPATKALVPVASDAEATEGGIAIDGPFSYFVSALVSRFESNFVVAPLRSPHSPLAPSSSSPSIDVVIIRPLRDLSTANLVAEGKDEEAATHFVGQLWGVTGAMYDGGKHIDAEFKDQPGAVVEYFRCGGFRWAPAPSDETKSNLVCLDGALRDLGRGGQMTTLALGAEQTGLRVWA